jgi:tellurite resistance protein TerC
VVGADSAAAGVPLSGAEAGAHPGVPAECWLAFAGVVGVLLFVDLFVLQRRAHRDSLRAALAWSAVCVGTGLLFSLFVGYVRHGHAALAYLTAFLVEESLSVDNLFVFLAIFGYFSVPPKFQHRVLFWGIVGAILARGLFIFAGVALIHRFEWLLYVLGAVLILTGARLAFGGDTEVRPEKNPVVRFASRVLPMAPSFSGDRFIVRTPQGRRFTPLILVLLAIESTDIIFAVDSVPAVLAISQDPFVVYTSNIFAIVGLRALYFVLQHSLLTLRFLRPALSLILVLIGMKMVASKWVHVPIGASLGGVAAILTAAVVLSLAKKEKPAG